MKGWKAAGCGFSLWCWAAACATYPPLSPLEPGDAPPTGWAATLEGDWMQQTVGDCILFEDWLRLSPPGGLEHVAVDRNLCGPRGVYRHAGEMQAGPGQRLALEWAQGPQARQAWQFTATVIDLPDGVPETMPADYQPGDRVLNVGAFLRGGTDRVWVREQALQTFDADGLAPLGSQIVSVTLSTDREILAVDAPEPCTLSVMIAADVDLGTDAPPGQGSEEWLLPCHVSPSGDWVRVSADGFEDSTLNGSWGEFLTRDGFWDRHPPAVASVLFDAFRPVLYFTPERPGVLFHDVAFLWYREMLNPPPDQVE